MIVATFCMQLVRAAIRRDENALGQAVSGTVVGIVFMFGATSLTMIALTVVDALSAALFASANSSISESIRRIVQISAFGKLYPLGWAIPALVALGCAIGAFLYWATMVFRKVAILILVTLAVFAGSGGGWEGAKRWRRGWIEATATLVVSKLLMTVVFVLGISALGKTEPTDGLAALSDVMAGIVILVLVLLCPMMTYKFIHWAGEGNNASDLHGSTKAGLSTAAAGAKAAGGMAMRGIKGMGGGSPQGPSRFPGMGRNGLQGGIDPSGGLGGGGGGAPTEGQQTSFRFGAPTGGTGDRGAPLIRRPQSDGDQGQALIRNATDAPHTATAPPAQPSTPPSATRPSTSASASPTPAAASTSPTRQPGPASPAGTATSATSSGSGPASPGPAPAAGANPVPSGPTVAPPAPAERGNRAPQPGPSPQGGTVQRFVFPTTPPTGT